MEDRKYRKYAKEFKLEALELLKHGDRNASEIERQLEITPGSLQPSDRGSHSVRRQSRSMTCCIFVHRRLVQSPKAAFIPGLSQPGGIRTLIRH
jgi:hypothetical protein